MKATGSLKEREGRAATVPVTARAKRWCPSRLTARRLHADRQGTGEPDAPIRVLIVDDHAVFREGVRALFEFCADIDVVAEAADAAEAVRRAGTAQPDVVLLDVRLPDGSGVGACHAIHVQNPGTAVLMLTAFSDPDMLFAAIEGGAAGYLLKHADGAELAHAIRRVAAGESYLDPAVATYVLARMRDPEPDADDRLARLTPTEQRILELVAKGLTNRQIGAALGYAESTAKNYVSSILAKLEVSRRTEAVAYLLDHDHP